MKKPIEIQLTAEQKQADLQRQLAELPDRIIALEAEKAALADGILADDKAALKRADELDIAIAALRRKEGAYAAAIGNLDTVIAQREAAAQRELKRQRAAALESGAARKEKAIAALKAANDVYAKAIAELVFAEQDLAGTGAPKPDSIAVKELLNSLIWDSLRKHLPEGFISGGHHWLYRVFSTPHHYDAFERNDHQAGTARAMVNEIQTELSTQH